MIGMQLEGKIVFYEGMELELKKCKSMINIRFITRPRHINIGDE